MLHSYEGYVLGIGEGAPIKFNTCGVKGAMSFLTLIHPALIQHLLNGASKPRVHQTQEHRQMDSRVGVGTSRAPYAKAAAGVPALGAAIASVG